MEFGERFDLFRAWRRASPLTDPPDRDLDPPEPSEEDLRREKLRMEWEEMQEDADENREDFLREYAENRAQHPEDH